MFFRKLIVPLQRNIERRERRKEEKALVAARIEKGVESTLLDRLKKGVVSITLPLLSFIFPLFIILVLHCIIDREESYFGFTHIDCMKSTKFF